MWEKRSILLTRQMLVKTTMRCFYTSIRMVNILKDSPCPVVAKV